MEELEVFNKLKIGLASDEKIREWSHGDVKKPETSFNIKSRFSAITLFSLRTPGI